MTEKEILEEAKSLIEVLDNWTKGALARDKYSQSVDVSNDDACMWCATGAIYKVGGERNKAVIPLAEAILESDFCTHPISGFDPFPVANEDEAEFIVQNFNDRSITGHSNVMFMFNRAIAKLSETQGD